MEKKYNQAGFTLIELMISMLIVSVLIVPFVYQKQVKFKEELDAITLSEIQDIGTSAQNYAAEQNLSWPDEENQCSSAISLLKNEGYLSGLSDNSVFETAYKTTCTSSPGSRFSVEVDTKTSAQAEILASYLASSVVTGKTVSYSIPLPSSIPALEHLLPRDGSRPMTGDLDLGDNNIVNINDATAKGDIEADRIITTKILDKDDPDYYIDLNNSSHMNNVSMDVASLENSYVLGDACRTKQIGTTINGELLTCVSGVWTRGGSSVQLKAGTASHGQVVKPIDGFTPDQCVISLSGVPYKNDGGYKRSRHFSHYYNLRADGWQVMAGVRDISDNRLRHTSAVIQYSLVCSS